MGGSAGASGAVSAAGAGTGAGVSNDGAGPGAATGTVCACCEQQQSVSSFISASWSLVKIKDLADVLLMAVTIS